MTPQYSWPIGHFSGCGWLRGLSHSPTPSQCCSPFQQGSTWNSLEEWNFGLGAKKGLVFTKNHKQCRLASSTSVDAVLLAILRL